LVKRLFVASFARGTTMSSLKEVFSLNWRSGHPETPCGRGSKLQSTVGVRRALPGILERYKVAVINDAGCGDCNWIRHVPLRDTNYRGYDVFLREDEIGSWSSVSYVSISELDVTTEVMPQCDLIICRDVFPHLPNKLIESTLELFRKSGPLLLSTSFREVPNVGRHEDISTGVKFSPLDLCTEPFSLGVPLEVITEEDVAPGRFMGLWSLRSIE